MRRHDAPEKVAMGGSLRWNGARKQWQADVRIGGRRLRPLLGTDRKVADAILDTYRQRALLAKHGLPIWVGGTAPRFEEHATAIEKRWRTSQLSPHTIRLRAVVLNNYLLPAFRGLVLTAIDTDAIQRYTEARLRYGAAPSTVWNDLDVLRLVLKDAQTNGKLAAVPRFPAFRRPEGRDRYLTGEQVRSLLDACTREPSLRWFVWIVLTTGLRVRSVMALRRGDVDLERGAIVVRVLKGGGRLLVPLDPKLAEEIRSQAAPLDAYLVAVRPGVSRTAWASRHLRRAGDRAGIERVGSHLLRHTVATWLGLTGASAAVARDLLGHASVSMTNRYLHAPPEAQRLALERLPWAGWAPGGQQLRLVPPLENS